jgi:hypothetical protein
VGAKPLILRHARARGKSAMSIVAVSGIVFTVGEIIFNAQLKRLFSLQRAQRKSAGSKCNPIFCPGFHCVLHDLGTLCGESNLPTNSILQASTV